MCNMKWFFHFHRNRSSQKKARFRNRNTVINRHKLVCDLRNREVNNNERSFTINCLPMLIQVNPVRYQPWATLAISNFHHGIHQRIPMTRGSLSHKWKMQSDPQQDSKAKKVMSNIFEGKVGQRGEIYVLLQFLLISQVVSPPGFLQVAIDIPPPFHSILFWIGLIPLSMGMGLAGQGSRSLGENLTPWPKPTEENQLTTDGAYALCRHPIYGGLLLACLGLSLTTVSPARFLCAAALFVLIDQKAARFDAMTLTFLCAESPSCSFSSPNGRLSQGRSLAEREARGLFHLPIGSPTLLPVLAGLCDGPPDLRAPIAGRRGRGPGFGCRLRLPALHTRRHCQVNSAAVTAG
jgi:protein-S-isoprenylcysteine O-methyltransferase Ste14